MKKEPRVYLSPPEIGEREREFVNDALDSNWISPLGPHVDAFEQEFSDLTGKNSALALSSGTAALHLALITLGVRPGDEVMVSSLTFAATVNPVLYVGAIPVFIDSEQRSWNMDPNLLAEAIKQRRALGKNVAAVIVVHIYGQSADLNAIMDVCNAHDIPLIEDAAEALGATYEGRPVGAFGRVGFFSFNGNKIITTSGGGMLVSDDEQLVAHARKLSTQAREPAPHYEHAEIGYNYRLSNLLAALGRAQLLTLKQRVEKRRANFAFYATALAHLSGVTFMPEAGWGTHTRWLTCAVVDADKLGVDREQLRLALEEHNIESRPLWKPMHLQPVFKDYPVFGGSFSAGLFAGGLCLPSGSSLDPADRNRVVSVIEAEVHRNREPARSAS